METNLFTTATAINLLTHEQRMDYLAARDSRIIELFKIHKTPTKTARAFGNGITRWVVLRVASRAGLWNLDVKQKQICERQSKVKKNRRAYQKMSSLYITEEHFQSAISSFIQSKGLKHRAEVQIAGCQSRADFIGDDFVIEAKNTVASDELCRGLGQCLLYRQAHPEKRIAVVYPDDLEPKSIFLSVFATNGFSLIPFSKLEKWLP